MAKRISKILDTGMEALARYPWPGNIRELQNFVERAVVLSTGDVLQIPPMPCRTLSTPERVSLKDAERDHILKVLEESNWVVGGKNGAAARLGVARTTLMSKMQKRGLSRRMAQPRFAM